MSLNITKERIKSSKTRIEQYIDNNLLRWAEDTALPKVKSNGFSKGLSSNSVDAITVKKTGFMAVSIVWDLKTDDGKPLDMILEEGTKPHDIEARFAKFLRFFDQQGNPIFRKKVNHPGTAALNIFKDSKETVESIMDEKISNEVTNYLDTMRIQ